MTTELDQTTEAELSEAMAPFMALPVATPQMMLAMMQYITRKLAAVETKREDSPAGAGAAWMTITQLATHFGYHRVTMHRILAPYLEAGAVRCIQPKQSGAAQRGESNRRYSVEDVTAALMNDAAKTGKGEQTWHRSA